MRKLLQISVLIALFSLFVAPASAQNRSDVEWCLGWRQFAEIMMHMRQTGVPFATALDSVLQTSQSGGVLQEETDFAVSALKLAYSSPLETTDRMVEVAKIEFADEIYAMCMSAAKG